MVKKTKTTSSEITQKEACGKFEQFSSFEQIDSVWAEYMNRNVLDSAILVIEYAQKLFPEKDMEITCTLGFMYALANKESLALSTWSYGQTKGYYFALDRYTRSKKLKKNKKYIALAERDKQIGDSINNVSHVEYEVSLPEKYSNDKIYSMLFVFHGAGSNLNISKSMWNSEIMNKNFITVYIQSYIIGFRHAYDWVLNDKKTNKEIKEIYNTLMDKYSANIDKVFLLGFSAGGRIALDYAFNNFVPVSGLLVNCPSIPNIPNNLITEFVNKEKKLVILTGEYDWALNQQKDLIGRVNNIGGSTKFRIEKGIGHTYSINFSGFLNEYLVWIDQ